MSQFINLAGELRYVSEFCRKGGPLQPDRTASFGRGTASVLMNGEGSPLFDGVGRAGVDNLAQKTGPEQCGCLRVLTPVVSEHLRRGNDHIHEAGYFAAAPSYFGRGVCSGALHLPGGGARFQEGTSPPLRIPPALRGGRGVFGRKPEDEICAFSSVGRATDS